MCFYMPSPLGAPSTIPGVKKPAGPVTSETDPLTGNARRMRQPLVVSSGRYSNSSRVPDPTVQRGIQVR